jgi:hypothetical protein
MRRYRSVDGPDRAAEGGGLLTPNSISATVVFPSTLSRFNDFLDRANWLALALEARRWELAGAISGTVLTLRVEAIQAIQDGLDVKPGRTTSARHRTVLGKESKIGVRTTQ